MIPLSNSPVESMLYQIIISTHSSFYAYHRCVCLSPQTLHSVLKLEGWNFAYRLLIWMPKIYLGIFLKFWLGAEFWGFSGDPARLAKVKPASRHIAWASLWGVCMRNFRPFASRLSEERGDRFWNLNFIQARSPEGCALFNVQKCYK